MQCCASGIINLIMIADRVLAELEKHASPTDAVFLQRFFKTGQGQYGAGDVFIGVRVPATRAVARQFGSIAVEDIEPLLESPIHEMRLCAVIIMAEQAKRSGDAAKRKALLDLYLHRADRINNWDIVDVSCRDVVGQYVIDNPGDKKILRKLAVSNSIWERRIAIVSTWQMIRAGELDLTFEVAGMLLGDRQDLMHKAVGWMLREAGKKDPGRLRRFLTDNIARIPRTALRYAIECFDPQERQYFLKLR
jgi:3-methyladenine DNA glycosylase AlkD